MTQSSFAIWLTGLPASGKSTITALLKPELERLGLTVEVLESDEVRRMLTPGTSYSQQERDVFYRALAFTGARLVANGITVLFDATASHRAYREFARQLIPQFAESRSSVRWQSVWSVTKREPMTRDGAANRRRFQGCRPPRSPAQCGCDD